ncbi:MAG: enoyl-CoA hydratase-related protein [Pararhizobium sp.]
MANPLVVTNIEANVATITIQRPDALNALNAAVLAQLEAAILEAGANETVRVLMLTGRGERAFIAGADVVEFVGASPTDALAITERTKRVVDSVAQCRKPVLAVINGYCFGAGFELALACDLRIASTKAQMGLPEIKLGIMPGGGGTARLTKLAGSSIARTLAMTGDPISAHRAFELGLVASVHDPDDLMNAAVELSARLALLPPIALTLLKSTLNIAVDADTETACQAEFKSFAICFSTADKEEGVKAFLEKRKPIFMGN